MEGNECNQAMTFAKACICFCFFWKDWWYIHCFLFTMEQKKKNIILLQSCYMHFPPLNMVVKITETSHPLMLICHEIRQCVTTIYALFSNNLIWVVGRKHKHESDYKSNIKKVLYDSFETLFVGTASVGLEGLSLGPLTRPTKLLLPFSLLRI